MDNLRSLELNKNQSYFLFGPRGTGKTTYLRKRFINSLYLDLLNKDLYFDLLANPSRLINIIGDHEHVIIDEVQKIPDLLDIVHDLIERKKIHFILTGSSARKLKKNNVNLLAGRAITAKMFPMTVGEIGEAFDLEFSLNFGMLPTLYDKNKKLDPDDYLKTYVDTYLREEIQAEGLTRNLGGFAKFLEVASFSQAETVNMSEIARESSNTRKMVENYFSILEDLLIAFFIPVFTKKAKRKLVAHKKFFFFDVGVYRTLRPKGFLDSTENVWGASLETLVVQELRAINFYKKLNYEIYFWRSQNGDEVDFVLYGEKELIAIEVKT